jgi:hypothetical protein
MNTRRAPLRGRVTVSRGLLVVAAVSVLIELVVALFLSFALLVSTQARWPSVTLTIASLAFLGALTLPALWALARLPTMIRLNHAVAMGDLQALVTLMGGVVATCAIAAAAAAALLFTGDAWFVTFAGVPPLVAWLALWSAHGNARRDSG